MEINPAELSRRLWESPAEKQDPDVSPYLLEHVLVPYLCGEEIKIASIDFAAFSPQEMGGFLDYVHQLAGENNKTSGLWESLQQHKPKAGRTPSFC